MKVTDRAIALLLQAGLAKRDAVAAFKSLLIHTFGAAAITAGESRDAVRRSASHGHQAVPADLFPAMAHVAAELDAALGNDDAFELGLIILLDGVARHAVATSAHRTDPAPPHAEVPSSPLYGAHLGRPVPRMSI